MATAACAFCVTDATLIYSPDTGTTWYYIPATISVTFRPERQEADRIRHSSSGGARVSPCSQDSITWFLDVITTLCQDDWLYRQLTAWDTVTPANNDGHIREGDIFKWRVYKELAHVTGASHDPNAAWAIDGKVVINNLVLDNNDDNNPQGDFTIEGTSDLVWPSTADTQGKGYDVDMTAVTFGA